MRASKKEEKNRERENCERYIVRKRAMSEKKKRVFFFFFCSLFNIVKLFGVCPMIFPFKEKRFPRKSLYSCVVVLSLYLLKFIHNYIEFFPTKCNLKKNSTIYSHSLTSTHSH